MELLISLRRCGTGSAILALACASAACGGDDSSKGGGAQDAATLDATSNVKDAASDAPHDATNGTDGSVADAAADGHAPDASAESDGAQEDTGASTDGAAHDATADAEADATSDAARDAEADATSNADAAADASPHDAAPDATNTGCNTLSQLGTALSVGFVDASLPATFTGGTIASGTYVATAATLYATGGGCTIPAGLTFAATYQITTGSAGTGTIQSLVAVEGIANATTATYAAGGTASTLAYTQTCPAPAADAGVSEVPYTVSGSTITFAEGVLGCGALVITATAH